MRKQILEALKAKFEGVSESVLGRIADKLAKTVTGEDGVATAVDGVNIQSVIDSYADSRATEATVNAVTNYEKKHGLKDGQKAGGGEAVIVPENKNDDTPSWAKKLIEANEALSRKVADIEGEKIVLTRKGQLGKLIEKLPEDLRKPYARMSIDGLSDEEFTTLTAEIATEVEGISSTLTAKGAVFTRPTGGVGATAGKVVPTKEEQEAIVSTMGL